MENFKKYTAYDESKRSIATTGTSMEKESKEVVLPDFKSMMIEVYKKHDLWHERTSPRAIEARIDLCKTGYLLGYNESHSKLKLRIEELEKIMKKADEVVKATDHLLTGLATDGNAIEGFTDAWKASHDFLEERIKYEIDLVAEKRGISELKNTL